KEMSDENICQIWEEALLHLEQKLQKIKADQKLVSPLNRIRDEISARCKEAAYEKATRYRLAVPTGAGKTLSSFRFALTKAAECGMRHIFYIAPFRSILEQNTADIIDAIGNEKWLLEHHGEVILEDQEESLRYEHLIENWDDVPIIATSAVQFFNTFLKEKKRNLRRFHALCNSVIILDEVQAFPPKVMALFNLSVNFLTEICGSVVVLCTATQPLTEAIAKNKMMKTTLMTQPLSVYEPYFRRVTYKDCTNGGNQQWSIEEAAEFIRDKADSEKQVLAIFNTKSAAKNVYDKLKGRINGELFHLSTSMCAAHRNNVLKSIKKALKNGNSVTCISTQIVEAGWDVSFQCVIRSMAGLDNLIQAAGRCNRNGIGKTGTVYLIQMNDTAEKVTSLPEIRKAQQAMRQVLNYYYKKPEHYGERLDSEKIIERYYTAYLMDQSNFCYPVKELQTDIVDLLSDNKMFQRPRTYGPYLRQAFQSAGQAFSLIEEKGGIDVVVPYGDAVLLLSQLDKIMGSEERIQLMRKLQRYIVNVSDYILKKIGSDVVFQREDGILVLDCRYYDGETGVQQKPEEMVFLSL
ncbi:MAG: CRISPR-associated helicase Cas3', partial [Lachnoclostridium edouardi]|uniref:CRISPR-associated helicase Cas3' n=1 Tax=Lachnoclostridium edouardi TaxID=1926283 RepID=UPI0026DAD025